MMFKRLDCNLLNAHQRKTVPAYCLTRLTTRREKEKKKNLFKARKKWLKSTGTEVNL